MSNVNLLAGLEAWEKQEAEIDIDIEVGAPEEVEAVAAEASEEVAEVVEAEAEVEEEATATEEMLAQFALMDHMYEVLKEDGANRTFMKIFNRNDSLANTLKISLPSFESFDTVGDVNSAETIACMEGLKEGLTKVWAWIKSVCQKIASMIARFIEAIRQRFGSLNKTIGRLEAALKSRIFDADKAKGAKVKVVNGVALANASVDKTVFEALKNVAIDVNSWSKVDDSGTKKVTDTIAKAEEALKTAKAAKSKAEASKVDLSSYDNNSAANLLKEAASIVSENESYVASLKKIMDTAKAAEVLAKQMESRSGDDDKELSKNARKQVQLISKVQKMLVSCCGQNEWAARKQCFVVGQYIKGATKKA